MIFRNLFYIFYWLSVTSLPDLNLSSYLIVLNDFVSWIRMTCTKGVSKSPACRCLVFSANCYDLLISIRNHSITPGIGFSLRVPYVILPVAHGCIEKQNDISNPFAAYVGQLLWAIYSFLLRILAINAGIIWGSMLIVGGGSSSSVMSSSSPVPVWCVWWLTASVVV